MSTAAVVSAGACKEDAVRPRSFPAEAHGYRWLALPAIACWCGLLFFLGLSRSELHGNEGLRARVAWEMLHGGSWLVPKLYGQPLLTKPPGHYLAIALLSLPAGAISEWTARLPSALAASAAVGLFFWYFRRQLGMRAGLVAAFGLPMSFLWLDKSLAAEIDMLHAAWVTAAILLLLRALEAEEQGGRRCPWWLAALGCVAGGVLTKWTAPVFFYGTLIPLLWWRGELRLLWCRRHMASAAFAATLCLGWAGLAAHSVGWQQLVHDVSHEAWMKVAPSHHRQSYPLGQTVLHPLVVLAAALPASLFALGALRPRFSQHLNRRGRRALESMHCWVWPNLLFWSLLPEHSPRHALPLLPGLAGLGTLACVVWLRGPSPGREATTRGEAPAAAANPVSSVPVSRAGVLALIVLGWLLVKLGFVYWGLPARTADGGHSVRATGQRLAAAVPASSSLNIGRLKDETLMFYYGRPVRRVADCNAIPHTAAPTYCLLDKTEWQQHRADPGRHTLLRLCDGQGQPIYLTFIAAGRITAASPGRKPTEENRLGLERSMPPR